jgi:hypothetical protein
MNFNTGGGTGTTAQVSLDPASAAGAIQQAVAASGGTVTQAGGNSGTFTIGHGKWYLTLWMKVKMDGQFSVVSNGNGGSTVSISLATSMNALMPILAVNLICGLVLGPLVLVAAAADAYTWWYYNAQGPRDVEGAIMKRLGSVAPAADDRSRWQNPAQPDEPHRASAQNGYPQNQASEPLAKPAGEDPYDQLRKLASLREVGAITPEEFEAKKAEILGRM